MLTRFAHVQIQSTNLSVFVVRERHRGEMDSSITDLCEGEKLSYNFCLIDPVYGIDFLVTLGKDGQATIPAIKV